jgi:hypothetical protein
MNGYFRVDRRLFHHPLWDDRPFTRGQAWIHILGNANWKNDARAQRGEHITRQRELARVFGWDAKKVRAFLRWLQSEGMIEYRAFPGERGRTIIRIANYAKYQGESPPSPTQGEASKTPSIAARVRQDAPSSTPPFSTEGETRETPPSFRQDAPPSFPHNREQGNNERKTTSQPLAGTRNDVSVASTAQKPQTADGLVFQALREGKLFEISAEDVQRAGRMIYKRCNSQWTPFGLAALWYAAKQQPPPKDIVAMAVGHMRGKTGARADFEGYLRRADVLLTSFRRQVERNAHV